MKFPEFFESAAAHLPADPFVADPVGVAPDPRPPSPAPWFVDPPGPSEHDTITTISIPNGSPTASGPPFDIDGHDWGESDYGRQGSDAIACYVPWHSKPARWGIYFFERPFFAFVRQLSTLSGAASAVLAPIVLRQVLFHELCHFRFEVVGSEIEDVVGRPLYLDYLRSRFGWPFEGHSGPIEESIATWNEVRYARGELMQFLRPKRPGTGRLSRTLRLALRPATATGR